MIQSREDYKYYLEMDKKALGKTKSRPSFLGDETWKFEVELRRGEYLLNCHPFLWKIRYMISRYRFHNLGIKCCGYSIPYNTCEEGLALVHLGTIVINNMARIGHNCRINTGVTIGATNGSEKAPVIGNNVFISCNASIIGDITVGDNVAIGANAVVVKDVRSNVTVGGVPAKVISENTSESNMVYLKNY